MQHGRFVLWGTHASFPGVSRIAEAVLVALLCGHTRGETKSRTISVTLVARGCRPGSWGQLREGVEPETMLFIFFEVLSLECTQHSPIEQNVLLVVNSVGVD